MTYQRSNSTQLQPGEPIKLLVLPTGSGLGKMGDSPASALTKSLPCMDESSILGDSCPSSNTECPQHPGNHLLFNLKGGPDGFCNCCELPASRNCVFLSVVYTHLCACGVARLMSNVFLCHSLPIYGHSLNPIGESLGSSCCSLLPRLALQTCTTIPSLRIRS